jgi:hypothetical protein
VDDYLIRQNPIGHATFRRLKGGRRFLDNLLYVLVALQMFASRVCDVVSTHLVDEANGTIAMQVRQVCHGTDKRGVIASRARVRVNVKRACPEQT